MIDLDVDQIVIEAAQPRVDLSILAELRHDVALGVINLADLTVESPETVADRLRGDRAGGAVGAPARDSR